MKYYFTYTSVTKWERAGNGLNSYNLKLEPFTLHDNQIEADRSLGNLEMLLIYSMPQSH